MDDAVTVVAGIVRRDDRILLTQRYANTADANKWELPKGKLNPDESEKAGLEREIGEEVGSAVEVLDLVASNYHTYAEKPRPMQVRLYETRWLRDEPRPIQCQAVAWVPGHALTTYDLADWVIPFLEKIPREY